MANYSEKDLTIISVIQKYAFLRGLKRGEIGTIIGKKSTWYERTKNPGNLRLDEIRAFQRVLKIPAAEIIDALI